MVVSVILERDTQTGNAKEAHMQATYLIEDATFCPFIGCPHSI